MCLTKTKKQLLFGVGRDNSNVLFYILMKIIQQNPFRTIGVLAGVSARELQKQKSKISAYAKAGKDITSDYDFNMFGKTPARGEDVINQAFADIEQNQDKVHYALFWFVNASPFDNTAIAYLKNNDTTKAYEIWAKVVKNKHVNESNYSAFSNLGTWFLLSDAKHIRIGIALKIKLINSEFFKHFVHHVADETFTIDTQKEIEKFVDSILTAYKGRFSNAEFLELFEKSGEHAKSYLSKKFTETPIHNIEREIEKAKTTRKANKSKAYETGIALYSNTKEDLAGLKSLLAISDLKYKMVADKLAKEIKQCSVDYFNWHQDKDSAFDYLAHSLKLVKLVKTIAVGSLVKEEIDDAISTLEEMKDKEINKAIALLESIKEAYEQNAKQVMLQVAKIKDEKPNASIDYFAVLNMIENSLNWSKVEDLIQEVIPKKNIAKIKNTQNATKLEEYKKLVKFIVDKIPYSYRNKVSYIKYWHSSSSPTTKTTSSISNTNITSDSEITESWTSLIILIISALVGVFISGFTGLYVGAFIGLIIVWIIAKIKE